MNESELDRRIDDRLRAAFAAPSASVFEAQARRIAGARARRPLWPWLLAAAALLVTTVFAFSRPRGPEGHDGHQLGAMWVAAYEHALSQGFGGGSCCEPALDLAKICEEKFAARLGLAPAGAVELLGCYCGLPTGGCVALMAKTRDDPVCVYVLPRGADPRPQLPAGSRLHLARREMGPLVLYALSQSAAADALGEFVMP